MGWPTATNPETGERQVYANGQWRPYSQTATDAEGRKAYLSGSSWLSEAGQGDQRRPIDKWKEFVSPVTTELREGAGTAPEWPIALGANAIAGTIEDPLYPLFAPIRAAENYTEMNRDLWGGRPGEAAMDALATATAAGESALMFTGVRTPGMATKATPATRVLDDFDAVNVPPSVATATEAAPAGSMPRGIATQTTNAIQANPILGVFARGQTRNQAAAAEEAHEALTDRFSATRTPFEGGESVQRGVRDYADTRFPAEVERRYGDLTYQGQALQPGQVAPPIYGPSLVQRTNSQTAVGDILGRFSDPRFAAEFRNPKIAEWSRTLLGGNAISFNDLSTFRSTIRQIRRDNAQSLGPKTFQDGDLARLEAALTDDLHDSIRSGAALGRGRASTQAERQAVLGQFEDVNAWYGDQAQRLGDLERVMGGSPEAAYTAVVNASRARGKGNLDRLRMLRSVTPDEEWDDISAVLLSEMGRPTNVNTMTDTAARAPFSARRFSESWDAMEPEARALLFGRDDQVVLDNLEAFSRVAQRIKATEVHPNWTSNASVIQFGGGAAVAAFEPTTAALLAGTTAGLGRLLTSPTFTRALVQSGSIDLSRSTGQTLGSLADYGRLNLILQAGKEAEPALAEEFERARREIGEELVIMLMNRDGAQQSGPQPDLSRPMLWNDDGSFSTVETITIGVQTPDGAEKQVNIPTIIDGRRVSEDEAIEAFYDGRNPQIGPFYDTIDEAVSAAEDFSQRTGEMRLGDGVQVWPP